MPMVSQYTIPTIDVARNAFVRNHSWKGTCDVGLLYPVFFDEVLPGDTKQLNSTFFGRLNPTVTPVLDNIWLDYHLFFVPNRLLWDNWQKFMGERKNPSDSIDYLVPTINSGDSGFTPGGLLDYLSVPPSVPSLTLSSVVFYLRAYNKIWNEWYRSELLQDSVTEITGDTGDTEEIYQLLPRGKRQDYFTSSFTQPQLGAGSAVPLGTLSGFAQVYGNGHPFGLSQFGFLNNADEASRNTLNFGVNGSKYTSSNVNNNVMFGVPRTYAAGTKIQNTVNDVTGHLFGLANESPVDYATMYCDSMHPGYLLFGTSQDYADGKSYTGLQTSLDGFNIGSVTINSLRQAIAIQQFLERDLMRGTRYIELVLSHFGVQNPDYRLQRPEYLGGSTSRININPVTQTSSTDATSPQGNLTGNGTVGTSGSGFTKSFTEHGVILGLVSFRVDLNYQQGVDRHFLRNTRYDYFFPTLAHLGMQGIYNKEIFAQGDDVHVDPDDDTTPIVDNQLFGYNTRYEEYRYKNSYITGKFRSSDPQSLDIWHLAEDFENLPVLNDEFIEVSDTLNRVMAVQSEPEILLDCYHEYTDVREVPMYGTPGLTRI